MNVKSEESWEKLKEFEWGSEVYPLPKISIIVPTLDSATLIASTLESLLSQDYPDFEVVVIDASSVDSTQEIVKSLQDPRVKFYTVTEYSRYEMLNKGITHATGVYINFLFPGDFYIYKYTLRQMMWLAFKNSHPPLVYCGSLLRDGRSEVKTLCRPLTLSLLRLGKQPTTLQSCWFRLDLFRKIGKFDTHLQQRGGFDLLCRFMLSEETLFAYTTHIFTDYDLRLVSREMVIRHFYETGLLVRRYFGLGAMGVWLFKQKDVARYLKLWSHSVKVAFLGK